MTTQFFPTSRTVTAPSTFSSALTRMMQLGVRGSGSVTQTDNTVASLVTGANPQGTGTVAPAARAAGVTLSAAGVVESNATLGATLFWLSVPINAVTISGSITANLRASESAVAANYGIGCKLYRISGGAVVSAFAQGSVLVELGTSDAANSITLTPTSTAFTQYDQIGLLIFFTAQGGTSASGRTAALTYNGATSAAAGDTFVTFNETFAAAPILEQDDEQLKGFMHDFVASQAAVWSKRLGGCGWQRRRSGLVVPAA